MNEPEMDEKFYKYMDNIGITEVKLRKRIYDIFRFYTDNLCPETIQDVFVTDYMTEGLREYENLWFFSENYAMEALKFISQDNFDITPMREISTMKITKTEYDFIKSNDKSKLDLFCETEDVYYQMRASKENCDYLKNIIQKYFVEMLKL